MRSHLYSTGASLLMNRANDPVRVCFLASCGELGGAESCLLDTLEVTRERHPDWEISLVVPQEGALAESARHLNVNVDCIPLPEVLARIGDSRSEQSSSRGNTALAFYGLLSAAPAWFSYTGRLRGYFKRLNPAVIYANGFKAQILATHARSRSSHLVWHTHDYVSSRPIMMRLFRRSVRRCSASIANSESVAQDIASVLDNMRRPLSTVIYNAVEFARFSPVGKSCELDGLSGLPQAAAGTVRVGMVATMAWWKGHRTFLEAFTRLKKLNVRGYLIGGPIYRTQQSQQSLDELRNEAHRLGIADRVGFTGFLPDTAAAFRSLDIVVHGSTRPEPFGRVLIEAMATGRPVITTGIGGAAEITAAGPGTMKFWPGEPDDLAKCIARLANDSALRKEMGCLARQTVEQNFGRRRLESSLERLWNGLSLDSNSAISAPAVALSNKLVAPGI